MAAAGVELNFSRGRKARTNAELRQQSLDRAYRPRLKEYGQCCGGIYFLNSRPA